MKTDAQLKTDILAELAWDPAVDPAHVEIAVREGVVTVGGPLASYGEKHAAERAIQRVGGVKALVIETRGQLPGTADRRDSDIARAARQLLESNVLIPEDSVRPIVENGWVTLTGQVEQSHQRKAVEQTIREMPGLVGITNLVEVKRSSPSSDIRSRIDEALKGRAGREAQQLQISVEGSRVILRGRVQSLAERRAIEDVAWADPGVASVINDLEVDLSGPV